MRKFLNMEPLEHRGPDTPIFPFSEEAGLKCNQTPAAAVPIFFFKLFITAELIDEIVFETNNYVQTVNSKRPLRRHSILNNWHLFNAFEMKKFLIVILHRLPTYQHYWPKKPFFDLLSLCVVSYKRFQVILRFWHFGS